MSCIVAEEEPILMECVCVPGPLRAVAVLLLVGLTWVLASSILGGDSNLVVKHFFSGKTMTTLLSDV